MQQDTNLHEELERQRRYLDQLQTDFSFPLFNSRRALESQRQSGYRNTAAAAREIIDNSVEAKANRVHVVFDRPTDRKAYQRKDAVTAVAFVDDGSGMLPKMARYALSWGGGTHFDDPEFIGRFGFGLPNASVNQTRRVEVYTRTSSSESWVKAWLDIDDFTGEGNMQSIPEPVPSELPEFVQKYLSRAKWELGHGTVVLWQNPDRLTYATGASLKEHLLDDFGVTYRYLLDDFELVVDNVQVQKVDPLFLDPRGRYYLSEEVGGAQSLDAEHLLVKFVRNPVTGERSVLKVEKPEDLEDEHLVAAGKIGIRIARFPLGFAVGRQREDGVAPIDEFAKARFEIRKSRRGISFVRAEREIETVDVFPRRPSDKAAGLGDWPLLEGYAYHWAMELRFEPVLDEVFGITNDKQTVRPIEDLWRILAQHGVDALLRREQQWQTERRNEARLQRQAARLNRPTDGSATPAELAAHAADISSGDMPTVPESDKIDSNLNFEREAQQEATSTKKSIDDVREALKQRQKTQRYRIDYVEDPNGPFYTPDWVGLQIVVRVNKAHPFFRALYGTLVDVPGAAKAKDAVDVLLFALAREELRTKNPATKEFYRAQRTDRWSPFISSALRTLALEYPDANDESEDGTASAA